MFKTQISKNYLCLVSLPHSRDSQLPNPKSCPPVLLTTAPSSASAPSLSLTQIMGIVTMSLVNPVSFSSYTLMAVRPVNTATQWSPTGAPRFGPSLLDRTLTLEIGVERFGVDWGTRRQILLRRGGGGPGRGTGQYHKRAKSMIALWGGAQALKSDCPSPALTRGGTSSKWLNLSGLSFITCQLN